MMTMQKILLVDDDRSLLKLLSIRLKSSGYEIETAENAQQALSRLAVFQPHLVITDLRMGEMDGLALFDRIHQQYPSLPVILLTALQRWRTQARRRRHRPLPPPPPLSARSFPRANPQSPPQ